MAHPHVSTRNKHLFPFFFLFPLTVSRFCSFLPSSPLPLSLFLYTVQSTRSHTDTQILTHTLLSPAASFAISLPHSIPSHTYSHKHTHALSGSRPTSTPQETALRPPPLCFPSLSPCCSECLSTTLTPPPPQNLSALSVLRGSQKPSLNSYSCCQPQAP